MHIIWKKRFMNQDDIFMKYKCAGSPEVLALMNDKTKLRNICIV